MRTNTFIFILMLAVSLALPNAVCADVAIIVNKANSNPVDSQFASKAFLGSATRWPSRKPVKVLELPEENQATLQLYSKLLHKTPAAVRDIWAASYFTGKALPPKQVANDAEMKKIVAAEQNAIGFIDAGSVDDTVKAVLTIK